MPPKIKLPSHGIQIWEGMPGAGKSFSAVDYLLKKGIKERRPVYTNLPIRYRVLKKYLQGVSGDDSLAGYIIPLSFDHFYEFVVRNHDFAAFVENHKVLGWGMTKIDRVFQEEYGPHVYKGENANWLYPTSLLVIDEFHRWCDQRYQKDEHDGFLTYATMHRHHMHQTILLTQDQMQVPLTWRRNKATVIRCRNLTKIPFMGGMSLPFQVFKCSEYSATISDTSDVQNAKPIKTWVIFPGLENGGLVFRLYDSFSHIGSVRRLLSIRDQVRREVEGSDVVDLKKQAGIGGALKQWRWGRVAAFLAVIALAIGGCRWIRGSGAEPVEAETPAPPSASGPSGPIQVATEGMPPVTAVTPDFAVVDRRTIRIGDVYDGWKLESLSPRDGETLWLSPDGGMVSVPIGVRSDRRGILGRRGGNGPTANVAGSTAGNRAD